jgi:group I intron endonuclease
MGYIYKITNTVDGKGYVGVTTKTDAIERYKQHIYAIYYGNGCPVLGNAVKKYGKEAFKFEVLIICFDEDIYKYEQSYITKYNTMVPNGYNVQEGGKLVCSFAGRKHTEETKKILREKSKISSNTPEMKEIQRKSAIVLNEKWKRGEISEKWKQAIANRKNKHHIHHKPVDKVKQEEIKKKISEGLKAYYKKNEGQIGDKKDIDARKKHSIAMRKANGRKVNQYSKENIFIASYDSIMEAAEKCNVNRQSIQANAARRTQTGHGFIWKYADIPQNKEIS